MMTYLNLDVLEFLLVSRYPRDVSGLQNIRGYSLENNMTLVSLASTEGPHCVVGETYCAEEQATLQDAKVSHAVASTSSHSVSQYFNIAIGS